MPCYHPLTAYYSRDVGASGKRGITFNLSAAFSGVKLRLPCGQCIGCRLERSRQWAIRCLHEKRMSSDSCFVTLTYNDANLPPGRTLVVRHLQLFMKRLRKRKGAGVRFYACGEYGEKEARPHYHLILYNCNFSDRKYFKTTKAGFRLDTSAELEEIWPLGHCLIGDVSFDSAAYVARYIMKKVTGDKSHAHYEMVDGDGEVFDRSPEFTIMSRRPGIGSKWFDQFGSHAYVFDNVVVNGKEVRPPRFYDTRYEVLDKDRLTMLKEKRRREAMAGRKDQTPERRKVRETVARARLSLKGRDL